MLALQKMHCLNLKLFFFPCPGAIMTFSSLIIHGISETKAVSFDPLLCILNGFSTEPYSVLFRIVFSE